ncbi:hypothetical protein C8Q73DRAFT_819387 [Cubamyces lactineus]|nr:hypothetical protein C8Q73DRAFT_819387 [Cubamyces lactineus]
MSPAIYSPVSPAGSFIGSSFDGMSFSPSSESLCPLLSSDDMPHPSLFDTYISEMVEKDMHRLAMRSTSDLSSPRSSTDEPPFPVSSTQDTITQKTIRAQTVKKKRSLGQALKALKHSQSSPGHSKAYKHVPFPLQLDESSFSTVRSEDMPGSSGVRREEEDGFDDRNRTVRRRNMPHHPFRYEDVPYLQAYSQILLENDFQTHELLRKLTPVDSPTFHNFGKRPPAEVLDLGCGEGFWVLHAAKLWKSHHTKVTGLDLIDVHNNNVGEVNPQLEPAHTPKNVTWFRANFVKYNLPFPDDSFDLVRMANLTLCIPIDRWRFVLTQVRRVLKPGGRLELIDDDMFFPRVPPRPHLIREIPPHPPPKDPPSPPVKDISGSPPKFRTQRAPSASRGEVPFMSHPTSLSRSASQRFHAGENRHLGSPDRSKKRHMRSVSEVDYATNAAVAGHLERIFDNMLVARGISPHPHTFLDQVLREVFGPDCARQTQNLELAVPTREIIEGPAALAGSMGNVARERTLSLTQSSAGGRRSEESEKGRPSWMTIEWDSKKEKEREKERRSLDKVSVHSARSSLEQPSDDGLPKDVKPKARKLLLGDDCVQAMQRTGPYQPPGLLLLPSTLIPCTPLELEMHACKNMNTLLGCKYALSNYMTSQRSPNGMQLVSETEVDDYLWDYECFRRKRFDWPQDIPGLQMEDEPEPAPPSKPALFRFGTTVPPPEPTRSQSSTSAPMYGGISANKEDATHVRTIRVYEAMKVVARCGCHCSCNC